MTMNSTGVGLLMGRAPQVLGLDHHEQNLLDQAWMQWVARVPRNITRLCYVDGKNKLKDLRVSIPPALRDDLDVVMGWPEKAVSEPANRTILDGIIGTGGEEDPLGVAQLLYANRFAVELPQAVRASMAYSCAFVSTTPGDTTAGEPVAMIQAHSALHATGIWDRRRRALSCGLLINDTDNLGRPTRFTFMTHDYYYECVKVEGLGFWTIREPSRRNRLGRVTLETLPLVPELDRPFGRARVDRRVMSITDRAVRTGARLDVHSELFSAMKLLLLGVDKEAFTDENGDTVPLWDWYMGRFNALSRDQEGEVPQVQQIKAESPEPHIATMRQLASEFSGHTGVPLGSLGVAQANPESADAKNVAREDIVFMVEQQHNVYGHAIRRTLENAVMIRDNTTDPDPEAATMQLLWRRPDRASTGALADAGMKQVQAAGLEGTEVGMRMVGMPQPMIRQATAELRRKHGGSVLDRLAQRQTAENSSRPAPVAEAVAPEGS